MTVNSTQNVSPIRLYVTCRSERRSSNAVVCEGQGFSFREDIDDAGFDLAFSLLLARLRNRLQLDKAAMGRLEAWRHALSQLYSKGSDATLLV